VRAAAQLLLPEGSRRAVEAGRTGLGLGVDQVDALQRVLIQDDREGIGRVVMAGNLRHHAELGSRKTLARNEDFATRRGPSRLSLPKQKRR
jgi:hypothetical protein